MSHVSIEHCSKTEKQNSCMGTEWLLSVSVVYPPDHMVHCHGPASQESSTQHITSLGKDQDSKFNVWFLLNVSCFLKTYLPIPFNF